MIPGELALAGKGVLFLDELPLFKKESIEALRGPMEEKRVTLHRLQQFFSYPVDCLFVAAMNPCPCGYFPDRNRCHCTPGQIRAYQRGISKPILERMDFMRILAVDYFAGCIDQGKRNFFGGFKKTGGKGKENAGKTLLSRREDTLEWRYEC